MARLGAHRSRSYSCLPSHTREREATSTLPRTRSVRRLRRAPSQACMVSTTVPQSIVPRSLGSRHQPTRSSLRHSRLLSSHSPSPFSSSPWPLASPHGLLPSLPHLAIRSSLLLLSLLFTVALLLQVCLAPGLSHAASWAPYSGPLLLAASLLLLLAHHWPGRRHTQTKTALPSLLLCLLCSLLSLSSCLGHLLHLLTLHSSLCSPSPPLSCSCRSSSHLWREGRLLYNDLPCSPIQHILPPILLALVLGNLASSMLYLLLTVLPSPSPTSPSPSPPLLKAAPSWHRSSIA